MQKPKPITLTPATADIQIPLPGQRRSDVPFNITLLHLDENTLKGVPRVEVLDSFDGATTDFHPKGLFSTEIFGRVGDDKRSNIFAHIDIKAPIFHPVIFNSIVKLKRFYEDIMAGKRYAIWDSNAKDFIPATSADGGRTGFAFFLEHWEQIEFVQTRSIQRNFMIRLVEKFKAIALTSKIVVMPAAYRDMEIDEFGRRSENEINDLYRRFISISNVIIPSSLETNPEVVDKLRYDMQKNFCALYAMIENIVRGKKKLFLGKFASRRIAHGTRNVLTSMNTSVTELGGRGNPGYNSTIIGLYQYLQANLLPSVFHVAEFLKQVFPDVNMPARLVDAKTLRRKEIYLTAKQYDRWVTKEGIEKVISSYRENTIRKKPIRIEGNYLGLVYEGPDGTFRFFSDIEDLPEGRSRDHVRPATLMDVLYQAVYRYANDYPIYVTRYPITGVGSIYPSMVHLRTTVKFSTRQCLGDDWQVLPEQFTAYEYPDIDAAFLNSLVPHSSHLSRLNADFDGDTGSGNIVSSDEAINEVKDFLKSRRAYVGTDGRLLYSTAVDTIQLVLHNMTEPPEEEIIPGNESMSLESLIPSSYDIARMVSDFKTARPTLVPTSKFEHMFDDLNALDPNDVETDGDVKRSIFCKYNNEGVLELIEGKYDLAKNVQQLYDSVPTFILTNEQLEKYVN